jgi:hypothetical protein
VIGVAGEFEVGRVWPIGVTAATLNPLLQHRPLLNVNLDKAQYASASIAASPI